MLTPSPSGLISALNKLSLPINPDSGGMATIICAALAMVAAQRLERMASLSILVSAGILLSAIGFAQPSLTAGALFYLVSSTLALSALFLLAELIERSRSANDLPLDEEIDALPRAMESLHPRPGVNLDDEQKAVVGQVIPWTMAFPRPPGGSAHRC